MVDDTRAEKGRPTYPVDHGDHPGGPLDRGGVEVEEGNKGHAFDEMWGIGRRGE